jgi:hypothetical protein
MYFLAGARPKVISSPLFSALTSRSPRREVSFLL